ncbi:hypothetical protein SS05631_a47080 (plasmid) [Sinorhizobium sp. CCBAU 05631]|nr:hypothetical protein SS05631_a47080 [Sinorhizobium sp. CCBAU 05631]
MIRRNSRTPVGRPPDYLLQSFDALLRDAYRHFPQRDLMRRMILLPLQPAQI